MGEVGKLVYRVLFTNECATYSAVTEEKPEKKFGSTNQSGFVLLPKHAQVKRSLGTGCCTGGHKSLDNIFPLYFQMRHRKMLTHPSTSGHPSNGGHSRASADLSPDNKQATAGSQFDSFSLGMEKHLMNGQCLLSLSTRWHKDTNDIGSMSSPQMLSDA